MRYLSNVPANSLFVNVSIELAALFLCRLQYRKNSIASHGRPVYHMFIDVVDTREVCYGREESLAFYGPLGESMRGAYRYDSQGHRIL